MNSEVVKHLAARFPEGVISDKSADLETYGKDWTQGYVGRPSCVCFPRTTQDVSAILAFCHEQGIKVVPSGGRTGLAAAAVAEQGEVVLSLQKMNRILKIDSLGMCAMVEAGVTTQELQEAAKREGLFFPLDLAAKGSCQLGGNLATNAGGLKFIRFGGAREQVLGIEVVLADGKILNLDGGLRKNNTGYDLKHLFVGSEGTLGVITKATLRLTAPPKEVRLMCLATDAFANIPKILRQASVAKQSLTAFEFFTRRCHELVLAAHSSSRSPFQERHAFYVLLEIEQHDDGSSIEEFLAALFEDGLILDGVMASTSTEFRELWSLRELITESIAMHGHVHKNDIAVAVGELTEFVAEMDGYLGSQKDPSVELVTFGHIGDGNLHINYIAPRSIEYALFKSAAVRIEKGIFELVQRYRGSISAEHGIGLLKKHELHYSRTESEVELMRQIKRVFDPKGILNPGKIFD